MQILGPYPRSTKSESLGPALMLNKPPMIETYFLQLLRKGSLSSWAVHRFLLPSGYTSSTSFRLSLNITSFLPWAYS